MWTSSSTPRARRNVRDAQSKFVSYRAPLSWTSGAIWRWRRRSSTRSPAARRRRPVHHASQHAGHRHVHAHRHGAAPEAAHRRRAWSGSTRSAASSATRAWTRSTTRSLPPSSSTQAYADFNDMMDLFEELLRHRRQGNSGDGTQVEWQGEDIDLAPGWPRLTMAEAVKQYLGVDFMAILDGRRGRGRRPRPSASSWGRRRTTTWGNFLYECFDQKVEEHAGSADLYHDAPGGGLARWPSAARQDPRLTERFELFICRSEMGNAFSELNDPIDQQQRFQKQVELRDRRGRRGRYDGRRFRHRAGVRSCPPRAAWASASTGCAMLLTGSDSIRDVLLFPTMKPLPTSKSRRKPQCLCGFRDFPNRINLPLYTKFTPIGAKNGAETKKSHNLRNEWAVP